MKTAHEEQVMSNCCVTKKMIITVVRDMTSCKVGNKYKRLEKASSAKFIPKRWHQSTTLQDVTSSKTVISILCYCVSKTGRLIAFNFCAILYHLHVNMRKMFVVTHEVILAPLLPHCLSLEACPVFRLYFEFRNCFVIKRGWKKLSVMLQRGIKPGYLVRPWITALQLVDLLLHISEASDDQIIEYRTQVASSARDIQKKFIPGFSKKKKN